MKFTHCLASVALVSVLGACGGVQNQVTDVKGPVDYVNPYMGNISHLLVPTFPTIHLPNSMLRVYPERLHNGYVEWTSFDCDQSSWQFCFQSESVSRG